MRLLGIVYLASLSHSIQRSLAASGGFYREAWESSLSVRACIRRSFLLLAELILRLFFQLEKLECATKSFASLIEDLQRGCHGKESRSQVLKHLDAVLSADAALTRKHRVILRQM